MLVSKYCKISSSTSVEPQVGEGVCECVCVCVCVSKGAQF